MTLSCFFCNIIKVQWVRIRLLNSYAKLQVQHLVAHLFHLNEIGVYQERLELEFWPSSLTKNLGFARKRYVGIAWQYVII